MIHNPILAGFHPDPSIVKAEGRYVIATSTFEWFPGVRFHTSEDLITWSPAGYALTDPEQLDLRGVPDSGGIWAPSLYWNDGTYTLVYTIVRTMDGKAKDLDNYITTATSLEGPWSMPVYVGSRGFDASLFHSDDGHLYMVCLRWDHRTDNVSFGGIQLQELNPVTFARIGTPRIIHVSQQPEITHGLIEGPNLYCLNGWYYLLLAEGGTGWNHGVRLARSRNIWGPYEEDPRPVLTTRDLDPLAVARAGAAGESGGLHKVGHGELLNTETGDWYLVHLASRPIEAAEGAVCVLGRETCLQLVEWTDLGWLRLANGGHLPALDVPARAPSFSSVTAEAIRDHSLLSPETMGDEWMTLRAPADDTWTGWSDKPENQPTLHMTGRESLRSAFSQSLVAHRVTSPTATLRATINAQPTEPFHRAGVTAYYNTTSHIFWHLTADDKGRRILAIEHRDSRGETDTHLPVDPGPEGPIHLEISFDGASVRAAMSKDGASWTQLGDHFDVSSLSDDHAQLLRFTGAFAGIAATDLAERSWGATFTDVRYNPNNEEQR